MASQCPKCHQTIEQDELCCADLRYSWKCQSCGKLSTGYVVPYGRCFLCGGENKVVEGYTSDDPEMAALVEQAVQFEVDMFHFYKIAKARTSNQQLAVVLGELYAKEQDHLEELDSKYHVHLGDDISNLTAAREEILSNWIFSGIDLDDNTHVTAVYDRAIEMERRTHDHFARRAAALPDGKHKELFRELAAEEEEHVAILETEREQFTGSAS